jgi:hypothetical protein
MFDSGGLHTSISIKLINGEIEVKLLWLHKFFNRFIQHRHLLV